MYTLVTGRGYGMQNLTTKGIKAPNTSQEPWILLYVEEILDKKPRFVTSTRFLGTYKMCLIDCLVLRLGTCKAKGLSGVDFSKH